MTPREAFELCRFTAACCPAQKFDEYTPDAWGLILADIRMVDAKEAVVAIKQRTPWVDPSEIIAEVKRIRSKRIDDHGPIIPPSSLDPDDKAAYREWFVSAERQIGDGNPPPEVPELPERDVKALTRGAFYPVPRSNR